MDKIGKIISDVARANHENNLKNETELLNSFIQIVEDNISLFSSSSKVDYENNNGFLISAEKVIRILEKYKNKPSLINDKNEIVKGQVLQSELYCKLGVVLIIFDGNPYTLLEMICLGILTHNSFIFAYDKFMWGTNELTINLVQSVLEKNGLKKEMFVHIYDKDINVILKNFKTINKTLIIGNHELQEKYLGLCNMPVEVLGYHNYEIYVDDLNHIDFVNSFLKSEVNVTVYVKDNLAINNDIWCCVSDVEEAVSQINYNGSGYCSVIFTTNNDSAAYFVKNINSKNVMVNTSINVCQTIGIEQECLLQKKTIIIPNFMK